MTTKSLVIPLIRGGSTYRTVSTEHIPFLGDEQPLQLSITPHIILSKSIQQTKVNGYQKLHATPIAQIIEIFKEASKIFVKKVPLTEDLALSAEQYSKCVTSTTGMPISFVQNALEMLAYSMRHVDHILEAMSPSGELTVYDTLSCRRGGLKFGWVPRGRNLGVIVPSNHPGVNSIWISALAMKYPVVVKPSLTEPFTPHRIISSLFEASLPDDSCHFLPLSHTLVSNLLNECDLSIIFGSAQTVAAYRDHARIKPYGPGESKIIVDANYIDSFGQTKLVDLITDSMMFDGGRSCINASTVLIYGENSTAFADEIARTVAENVFHECVLHPLNKLAKIPAFLNPKVAQAINQFITSTLNGTGEDLTYELRKTSRLVAKDELTYLLPTVIKITETENRLLGTEFPFPFITVYGMEDVEQLKKGIGNALVLAMVTEDLSLIQEMLTLPNVGKVYVGDLTCAISAAEPHEGLLSDFLFQKKAYRSYYGEDVRSFAKLYGKLKQRWGTEKDQQLYDPDRLPALFRTLKGKDE